MLLMQEGFLSRSVVQVIGPPLLSVFWVALFLFYLYGELKLYCIGVLAIFAISGAIGGIMSLIFLGNMNNTTVWENGAI